MLFAELPGNADVGTWVNSSLVGTLILLLGYLMRYFIPNMQKDIMEVHAANAENVKAINTENSATIKMVNDRNAQTIEALVKDVKAIRAECREERRELLKLGGG